MEFISFKSYEELSAAAADIISKQIVENPSSVLGLATGSSPLGIYAELAKRCARGELDFSLIRTVNLDEYAGLSADCEQSYRFFMNKNLFEKINIKLSNTHVPDGTAKDAQAECSRYDELVKKLGGIDLQLLGIGPDGHIGFNEPDSRFIKETHLTELSPSTTEANARFFKSKEEVPKKALTLGMGGIFGAKKIVLVANGPSKKEIVNKAFFGPITPKVPASLLQLHPDTVVMYSEV